MSVVTTGLIVSTLGFLLVSALFRYEGKREVRFFERQRTRADFFVLKISHGLMKMSRFLGREFVRQIFHYLFHTFLRLILLCMRKVERGLQNIMQVNKTLAKNVERENMTHNKLEEIALHRVETALTDKEKRDRKDKMLNGG